MDLEKRKQTKQRCTKAWKKKNLKSYSLEFNMSKATDREVYEYLQSHDNIRQWLISLIKKDKESNWQSKVYKV